MAVCQLPLSQDTWYWTIQFKTQKKDLQIIQLPFQNLIIFCTPSYKLWEMVPLNFLETNYTGHTRRKLGILVL